jgi:chromosome segregation ATPase
MSELEVKRLKMDLAALTEAKETTVKSFDTEKAKFMKEVESLKRKIEEIHASKEAAEEVGRNKDAEADRLKDEPVKIRVSVSQLQASCNELDAKHSRLNDEKNSVQKALVSEKVEGNKLKLKIEELKNYVAEKDVRMGN